jgi:hypothetical protein
MRARISQAVLSITGPVRCLKGMNAALRLLSAGLVLALAACGTYDPETRLFRQLAPKPEDVLLDAPGAETFAGQDAQVTGNTATQGMAVLCTEDRLRCHAQNIATGVNGLSFLLLTMVDTIVQFPPSSRDTGKRVWGPHFNRRPNNTARFEMTREMDGTFSYCLHMGPGDLRQADWSDISCADAHNELAGAVRVLSGTLSAAGEVEGEAARSGAGVLVFEPLNVELVGVDPDPPVNLTIAYDNTDGGTDIQLIIDEVGEQAAAAAQCDLLLGAETYRFTRDAEGAGTFRFRTRADFVPGQLGFDECETLTITSQWTANNSGRADATVSDGDLTGDLEQVDVTECWDDELTTVYAGNSLPDSVPEGDESACVFAAPLE